MPRRVAALVGFAGGMLPASAMAQATGGSVTSFGIGEWFGLLLRLGLVVGVIWAAVYAMRWYTRRAGGERGGAARTLDIVETRSLGPNRALHLVRIGGRAVLIGVTPERINALLEISDPEVLDHLELTTGGVARAMPTFSAMLAGFGAGGQGAKAELPELATPEPERVRQAVSWFRGFRRGLRRPAAPAASRESQRLLMDRVLALFGFTPVESIPQTVERLRAARLAAQAAQPAQPAQPAPRVNMEPVVPVSPSAAVSRFAPSVIAPSATQTLRALSGYRATQESSLAEPPSRMEPPVQAAQPPTPPTRMESAAREERIAEAQRAIVAARQKAG